MTSTPKVLPRDAFIDEIFLAAKANPNIYFITADLGAKALDRFRVELPRQFIHGGISEQNVMDLAAGLAQNGKIVYTYAMAPFVTLRCYEQIKVAIASMSLPVTIIGNGVGYSYNDAGPTHYATEDISCMRALGGIEILTASDTESTLAIARLSYSSPALRYVRLDRAFLPDIYRPGDDRFLRDGLVEIEHFLSGGMGGAIVEAMADAGILKPVRRIGIPDTYVLENGGRQYLHEKVAIDARSVAGAAAAFLNGCSQ